MITALCLFFSVLHLSCVSVNIELEPSDQTTAPFTTYHHYGLFGLVGYHYLDLQQACIESKAVKIKSYFSSEDALFALITLGLYSPKSTTIWCQTRKSENFYK